MGGINLATAFITLVPTVTGIQGKIAEALQPGIAEAGKIGRTAGVTMGEQMSAGLKAAPMTPAMTQVGSNTARQAEEHGRTAGGMLGGGMIKGFIAAGVTTAIIGGIKDSVDQYMNLAVDVNKIKRLTGGDTVDSSQLRTELELSGVASDKSAASLTIFSKNLGKASEDADKTAKMAQLLGMNFTDASGAVLPLTQLMGPLSDKFAAMPNGAEKTALAMQLFGKGGADMLPFLNKGSDALAQMAQKSDDLGLTLDDAAISKMGDAKATARDFQVTMEGLKVTVGEALVPVMTGLQKFMQTYLIPVLRDTAGFLRDNSGWLGPLAAGFAAVFTTMKIGSKVVEGFNAVMSANPIVKIITLLTLLAIGVKYAYDHFDWFRQIVDNTWTWIQNASQTVWTFLQPFFQWIGDNIHYVGDVFTWLWQNAIQPAWDGISNAFSWAWTNILSPIFEYVKNSVQNLIDMFHGVIDFFTGVFTGNWSQVWQGIQEIFGAAWNQIVNVFSTLGTVLWNIISGFTAQVIQWGQDLLNWLWQGIQNAAGNVWNWFTSLPGWIWDKVVVAAGWVTDRGGELIGWIGTGISNGAAAIWSWFSNLPANIWEAIKNIGSALMDFGGRIIGWIIDGIKAAASAVADAVTGLFDLKLNDAGTGFVTANPMDVGAAGGGVVARAVGKLAVAAGGGYILPGYAPGSDTVPAMLSPGEAVMVPEFVSMIGPANVYALNRMARGGRSVNPSQILGTEMFADGGIVGGPKGLGYMIGTTLADQVKTGNTGGLFGHLVQGLLDALKGAGTSVSGFNASQDPSSFGWQRAANIQGFSWNGLSTSVAGGTQGLWTALLNALAPTIPGGIISIGGFADRNNVNSPGVPSFHAYGLAMDVNEAQNPNGVNPASIQGGRYVIPIGPAESAAARLGMLWGGDFSGTKDPMHFEIHVPPGAIGGLGSTGGGGLFGSIASAYASKFAPVVSAIVGGAGVERWRGTVLQALGLTGQPASLADVVLHQMMTESSGDPNAINLTDINAQRGDPSIGLMQVIGSTFRSYALAPYNTNIRDPLSNIIAAIRYTISRYGGVAAGMQGHAYDNGGWLMPGGVGINLGNQPEAVFTPTQSDAIITHARALEDGFAGRQPAFTFTGDIHMGSGGPAEFFDEVFWRARTGR